MSGKSGLLGGMEEVEDEEKPPEQPIVERDPSGRWSRVRALHAGLQLQLLLFSVYGKGEPCPPCRWIRFLGAEPSRLCTRALMRMRESRLPGIRSA